MDKLQVLTLNVHGLANYKKCQEILSHFWFPTTTTRPQILFLQETHSTKSIEQLWSCEFQSRNVFFSHETTTAGGLLITIRNGLPFTCHEVLVDVSYIILYCTIAGEQYVLTNV